MGLPWRSEAPPLRNNFTMALTRLEGTERKLERQPAIERAYQELISCYEQKGYIQAVKTKSNEAGHVWYLPHFPVVSQDKSTSKVRPVFDASAKFKGVSLNVVLHQGPRPQPHHPLEPSWMTPSKWLSNNEEDLKIIPKEHLVSSLDLEAQLMPVIKTFWIT